MTICESYQIIPLQNKFKLNKSRTQNKITAKLITLNQINYRECHRLHVYKSTKNHKTTTTLGQNE